MSYEIYKFIHISGLILTITAIGAYCTTSNEHLSKLKKPLSIAHGIGLVLMLVAGFGMLARLGIHSMPLWVIIKVALWIWLGFSIMTVKRNASLKNKVLLSVVVASVLASYVAIFKI